MRLGLIVVYSKLVEHLMCCLWLVVGGSVGFVSQHDHRRRVRVWECCVPSHARGVAVMDNYFFADDTKVEMDDGRHCDGTFEQIELFATTGLRAFLAFGVTQARSNNKGQETEDESGAGLCVCVD